MLTGVLVLSALLGTGLRTYRARRLAHGERPDIDLGTSDPLPEA